MKFLCLAYGDEKDWNALTQQEQNQLLAQDEVIRKGGALMGAVEPKALTVRAWNGKPDTYSGSFSGAKLPLAGFSIIEATDIDVVVQMVSKTPCARAKGAIEIREITQINDPSL